MQNRTQFLSCAGAALLAFTFSPWCVAQSTPENSRVVVTHVKPDMLSEWVDLQKNEVVPALKKAGLKTRTVYSTSLFGNAYEFITITPFEKYAEFDAGNPMTKALGQPASARLGEKLRKCTESQTAYSVTRMSDISNVLDGPLPQMIVTVRYRISAGKMPEFQNLVKTEILPVYKKAKVALIVNRRGPGANPSDVTMTTGYSKFADLDGGPFLTKQLGQEAANRVNAKFAGIRTLMDVFVRTRVADLSF